MLHEPGKIPLLLPMVRCVELVACEIRIISGSRLITPERTIVRNLMSYTKLRGVGCLSYHRHRGFLANLRAIFCLSKNLIQCNTALRNNHGQGWLKMARHALLPKVARIRKRKQKYFRSLLVGLRYAFGCVNQVARQSKLPGEKGRNEPFFLSFSRRS